MNYRSLLLSFLLFFAASVLFAQSTQAFKYQAVARDADGFALPNTDIGLQIEIISTVGSLTINYVEHHFVTTNGFGLINIEIGNGEVIEGIFDSIPWDSPAQSMEISMDTEGGTNFVYMGSSPILSVPKASYANIAGNGGDTNLYNELQKIKMYDDGVLRLMPDGGEVDLSLFDYSEELEALGWRITNDSIYFEGEIDGVRDEIAAEIARATLAESNLAAQITNNALNIFLDSLHFQTLIDELELASNEDSLYFKELIDANTLRIINDSAYLKSLIDQNTYDIQQEITRAILAEAINATNINANTIAIASFQTQLYNDSIFFKGLIDQNTNSILAEITRAIGAEMALSNSISINSSAIAQNAADILEDSTNFQTQLVQIDYDLQEEITRSIYRDETLSDSMEIAYLRIHSDSVYFQGEIDNISSGGLDPTLENGKIFVGNSSDVATGVYMTGDAQISNSGSLIIEPNSITTTKVADGNITNTKLNNSSITVSDGSNSGQVDLGGALQFSATGSAVLTYNAATSTMNVASSDNQILGVTGNNLSISSGNVVDLSTIVGQTGPQGPAGPTGPAGPSGNDGVGVTSTVDNGDGTFTINYTDGSSFTTADFTGPAGPTGATGAVGPTGPIGLTGVGVQSTVD